MFVDRLYFFPLGSPLGFQLQMAGAPYVTPTLKAAVVLSSYLE
jgi:hypothetical protein